MSRGRRGHDRAILHTVRESLESLLGGREEESPEERLLAARDKIQVRWRKHRNSYIGVVGTLTLFNIMVMIDANEFIPFAPIMGTFWGAFLLTHFLNKRSWLQENARQIRRAEEVLGLTEGTTSALKAPASAPLQETILADGIPLRDPTWIELLSRGDETVRRAQAALEAGPSTQSSEQLARQLDASLADLNRLAGGAERIRLTLQEIAPQGMSQLDRAVDEMDERIARAKDDGLRDTYLANRSLLLSRRAKVEELRTEQARLVATAEGFLLAADNLRLDAARMGAGTAAPRTAELVLQGPASRLSEEVDLLRRVEAELERF